MSTPCYSEFICIIYEWTFHKNLICISYKNVRTDVRMPFSFRTRRAALRQWKLFNRMYSGWSCSTTWRILPSLPPWIWCTRLCDAIEGLNASLILILLMDLSCSLTVKWCVLLHANHVSAPNPHPYIPTETMQTQKKHTHTHILSDGGSTISGSSSFFTLDEQHFPRGRNTQASQQRWWRENISV